MMTRHGLHAYRLNKPEGENSHTPGFNPGRAKRKPSLKRKTFITPGFNPGESEAKTSPGTTRDINKQKK